MEMSKCPLLKTKDLSAKAGTIRARLGSRDPGWCWNSDLSKYCPKMHCELDLGSVESQRAPEEECSVGGVHCAVSLCAFSYGAGETREVVLDQILAEGTPVCASSEACFLECLHT